MTNYNTLHFVCDRTPDKDSEHAAAFAEAISGCIYGEDETRDARTWFKAGWDAAMAQPAAQGGKMNDVIEQHYKENKERLCKYMRFRMGNEWAAEDVVQEAYTLAIKYYDNFDISNSPFQAWFNKILINAAVKYRKEEMGHFADEFEEEDAEGFHCTLYSDQVIKQIFDLIESKEEPYREVLLLHFKHGYAPKDIAALTDATANVAYKTIAKFREELKGKFF